MAEDQRLTRVFRQALETKPDAALIGHGSGCGVALSLASRRIVTVWDHRRLAHGPIRWRNCSAPSSTSTARVAARAMLGEPRRLLDRSSGAETEVRLRPTVRRAASSGLRTGLLWPAKAGRGAPTKPREAISEANRWIARVEALLRRSGGALTLTQSPPAVAKRVAPATPPPTAAGDPVSTMKKMKTNWPTDRRHSR